VKTGSGYPTHSNPFTLLQWSESVSIPRILDKERLKEGINPPDPHHILTQSLLFILVAIGVEWSMGQLNGWITYDRPTKQKAISSKII